MVNNTSFERSLSLLAETREVTGSGVVVMEDYPVEV